MATAATTKPAAAGRRTRKPVSCDDCYFRLRGLCALKCNGTPCSTFRPYDPAGLKPPDQMRLVFRHEMPKVAWAFRSAEETAALYE